MSDKNISFEQKPIPSLLVVGALHHFLIDKGVRKDVSIIVEAGDIWEAQHIATLLSFGADYMCPYLAFRCCVTIGAKKDLIPATAIKKYIKAANQALLKIMSKLGISTLNSYKGAQTFEALGLATEVIEYCFKGTVSRIEGMRFQDLERENNVRHTLAFQSDQNNLPDIGNFQWKRKGEYQSI